MRHEIWVAEFKASPEYAELKAERRAEMWRSVKAQVKVAVREMVIGAVLIWLVLAAASGTVLMLSLLTE